MRMRSMMMMGWLATVTAAMLFIVPPGDAAAHEDFTLDDFELQSTEDLLDICTLEEAHESYWEAVSFCFGFFQGGVHYHRALANGPNFDPISCPTDEVTLRQLVSVFVTYARANPIYSDEPPMDTVFRAVTDQWPCE
jgi:hypothetical protein